LRLNEIKSYTDGTSLKNYLLREMVIIEKKVPKLEIIDLEDFCNKLIMGHFRKLRNFDQQILEARYEKELSYKVIGEEIGETENNARQLVFQAKRRWQREIGRDPNAGLCQQI
jgi:Sigma-70, region 4.